MFYSNDNEVYRYQKQKFGLFFRRRSRLQAPFMEGCKRLFSGTYPWKPKAESLLDDYLETGKIFAEKLLPAAVGRKTSAAAGKNREMSLPAKSVSLF